MSGLIAQLVEHLTFNQVVQGSSPCQPTNNIKYLAADKILEILVIVQAQIRRTSEINFVLPRLSLLTHAYCHPKRKIAPMRTNTFPDVRSVA